MDPSHRTLDSMLAPIDPSQISVFAPSQIEDSDRPAKRRGIDGIELLDKEVGQSEQRETLWDAPLEQPRGKEIPESVCEFTSIKELRKAALKRNDHSGSA